MKKFWFEFELDNGFDYPAGIVLGCGVTAIDYQDAISILKKDLFKDINVPIIKRHIEDVDISTLDQGHVIPNMVVPITRGIWFPQLK